ncbi:hypothetical protein JG666_19145, partial [Vibrio cholerae]|nr:hypothetical protein [Vibrio cholerae]
MKLIHTIFIGKIKIVTVSVLCCYILSKEVRVKMMRITFKGVLPTCLSVSVLLAGCGQEEASTNGAGNVPKVKDEFIKASDKAKSPTKVKERKD